MPTIAPMSLIKVKVDNSYISTTQAHHATASGVTITFPSKQFLPDKSENVEPSKTYKLVFESEDWAKSPLEVAFNYKEEGGALTPEPATFTILGGAGWAKPRNGKALHKETGLEVSVTMDNDQIAIHTHNLPDPSTSHSATGGSKPMNRAQRRLMGKQSKK